MIVLVKSDNVVISKKNCIKIFCTCVIILFNTFNFIFIILEAMKLGKVIFEKNFIYFIGIKAIGDHLCSFEISSNGLK